jgi:hypothetical protein
MKIWRRIGNMCKNLNNTITYDSAAHLFQRLKADMLACHHQMETLKILFKNFENSWLAITLEYKIVKDEMKEK